MNFLQIHISSLLLAGLFSLMLAPGTVSAVQIVDFSDYTAKDVDLLSNNSGADRPLDLSTARLGSSDFTTAPASPNVYAGSVGDQGRVFDADNGEAWGANVDRVAFLWQKTDFLNGGDSQPVSLDASSQFTFTWGGRANGESTDIESRWLILTGGNLYVSDEVLTLASPGTQQTDTSGSFTTMQWAQMDLDTSMNATIGSFASISLSDIDGVGVFTDTASNRYNWQDFTASATVVPEPGAGTLLMLSAGIVILFRRRKRF